MSAASARVLGSRSCWLGGDSVGAGVVTLRKARISCIAALLIGRLHLRNQAATEKSVHEPSGVEQVLHRCEAMFRLHRRIISRIASPIRPTGRDEGAAAVRQNYQ
jgi:hypothetical protein